MNVFEFMNINYETLAAAMKLTDRANQTPIKHAGWCDCDRSVAGATRKWCGSIRF